MTKEKFWKYAFFTLLITILTPILGLYLYIVTLSGVEEYDSVVPQTEGNIGTTTELSTASFNQLLDAAIGGEDVTYQLKVSDAIYFTGTFDVYQQTIPYAIEGDPHVDTNGNIRIDVKGIELAHFDLPIKTALGLFQLTVPDDVPLVVDAAQERLIIRLDTLSQETGLHVQAQTIDLEQDKIALKIDLPVEMLVKYIKAQ